MAQVKTFKPQLVAVRNESLVDELKEALADLDEKPEIIPGEQGVIEVLFPVALVKNLTDESHLHLLNHVFKKHSGCKTPRCSHCCYRNSWLCWTKGTPSFLLV